MGEAVSGNRRAAFSVPRSVVFSVWRFKSTRQLARNRRSSTCPPCAAHISAVLRGATRPEPRPAAVHRAAQPCIHTASRTPPSSAPLRAHRAIANARLPAGKQTDNDRKQTIKQTNKQITQKQTNKRSNKRNKMNKANKQSNTFANKHTNKQKKQNEHTIKQNNKQSKQPHETCRACRSRRGRRSARRSAEAPPGDRPAAAATAHTSTTAHASHAARALPPAAPPPTAVTTDARRPTPGAPRYGQRMVCPVGCTRDSIPAMDGLTRSNARLRGEHGGGRAVLHARVHVGADLSELAHHARVAVDRRVHQRSAACRTKPRGIPRHTVAHGISYGIPCRTGYDVARGVSGREGGRGWR